MPPLPVSVGSRILSVALRVVQRVVEPRHHPRGVAERRMRRDVLDALAVDVDLAPVAQRVEVFVAGLRRGDLGLPDRLRPGGERFAVVRAATALTVWRMLRRPWLLVAVAFEHRRPVPSVCRLSNDMYDGEREQTAATEPSRALRPRASRRRLTEGRDLRGDGAQRRQETVAHLVAGRARRMGAEIERADDLAVCGRRSARRSRAARVRAPRRRSRSPARDRRVMRSNSACRSVIVLGV